MIKILDEHGITFDDVNIVPAHSEILSRSDVNTSTKFTTNTRLEIPLVAAPMDTVCGGRMLSVLMLAGACGCLHRFYNTIDEQTSVLKRALRDVGEAASWGAMIDLNSPVCVSIGVKDFQERAEKLVENCRVNVLLIDVANGDNIHVKNAMTWINSRSWRKNVDVILGNVATADGAKRLIDWGANGLRVGIGGGSMCTTRIQTGIGVPQLSAILNVREVSFVPVIADGGIRYPGDVAKALAAGADTVMIGSLFAGTEESPGELFISGEFPKEKTMKVFRGSASMSAKISTKQNAVNIEGTSTLIEYKGKVRLIVDRIMDGVRSSMSYVGAQNLQEFRERAQFIRVSNASIVEAHPQFLVK